MVQSLKVREGVLDREQEIANLDDFNTKNARDRIWCMNDDSIWYIPITGNKAA